MILKDIMIGKSKAGSLERMEGRMQRKREAQKETMKQVEKDRKIE